MGWGCVPPSLTALIQVMCLFVHAIVAVPTTVPNAVPTTALIARVVLIVLVVRVVIEIVRWMADVR